MKTLIHTLRAAVMAGLLAFAACPGHAAPGDLDPLNANIAGFDVHATAVQPDGKTIIAGDFTSVLGVPRSRIARLNADGTLDMGFNPNPDGGVACVAVQADGKVLLGGGFFTLQPNGAPTSTSRQFIARVNSDGTLDTGFDPKAGGSVVSVAVQADGKVLLGGQFTSVQPNGAPTTTARQRIARVNVDGTLDAGFDPKANGIVLSVAMQADGKVLIGGGFTTLQPNGAGAATVRNNIARVNADGTLDPGFDPKANSDVLSVTVQADGKVLLGGTFSTLQPNGAGAATARQRIARVNADGTLDTGFDPKANSLVFSVAVQADGKVLLGGDFTTLQPNGAGAAATRQRIARVNSDGTLDTGFDPKANNTVYSVAVQADGKVLLGGNFSTFQPNGAGASTARSVFARLQNDPATQTLSVPDTTQALWTRGGAAPELSRVAFELSTDGGANWTPLGAGARIVTTANWERTGLALPASGKLRARGVTTGGYQNGSSGLIEQVTAFSFDSTTLAPTLIAPAPSTVTGSPVSVSFTLPEAALNGSVTLSFGSTELTLAASEGSAGAHAFSFNPATPTASAQVASGAAVVDGTYTVTLSYQDALGNPAASAVATNVEVDAVPNISNFRGQAIADGRSNITNAGHTQSGDGIATTQITLAPGSNRRLVITATEGATYPATFSLAPFFGPDGGNFGNHSASIGARAGISGLTDHPNFKQGLLAVFTEATVLNDAVSPPTLDFSSNHDYADLTPLLRQVFFVGDGRGTAGLHIINIPDSASKLHFGFADGGYSDNQGQIYIAYQILASGEVPDTNHQVAFPPTVVDDQIQLLSGTGAALVLANDTPSSSLPLSVVAFSQGAHGTVTAESTAQGYALRYTAGPLFPGTDSFTYTAGEGTGADSTATVRVTSGVFLNVLAAKGGAVPGAGVSGSGIAAGAVWATFGVPSINNNGQALVLASFKVGTVTTTAILGWELADMATMKVVAKKGDGAGISGVTMSALKEPLLGPDGSVAWAATLAGAVLPADNVGIFLDADGAGAGAPVLLARKGGIATGATVWNAFTSVALGGNAVAFTASLVNKTAGVSPGPGGATTLSDSGLWVYDRTTSTMALALREGDALLGSTVKTIGALVARPGSPGQGHGVESDGTDDFTAFRVTLADGRQAVGYVDHYGTVTTSYVGGSAAEGYGSGALWQSFGLPTQNAAATAMAFVGTVKSGTGTANSLNNVAIFAEDDVNYLAARIVAKGDATGVGSGIFSVLKDPVNASNRSVAFLGTMKVVPGITAADNDGVWHATTAGLSLIAREGSLAAEAGGGVWKAFTSLALPEGRGPLFVASMHSKTGTVSPGPGGITTANDVGLWATDSQGALRLLLQEGDAIGASTVKTFVVLSSVVGSPAQTRSFNSGGSVVVKATDALGAQHLLHIAVP